MVMVLLDKQSTDLIIEIREGTKPSKNIAENTVLTVLLNILMKFPTWVMKIK